MSKHRNEQSEELSEDSTDSTSNDKCLHLKKGYKCNKVKKALKNKRDKHVCCTCQKNKQNSNEVDENSTNLSLWMCLNCGGINCGSENKNHAKQHFESSETDGHSIAIDINNWTVWCFECEININLDKNTRLKSNLVHYKSSLSTTSKRSPILCQKGTTNKVEETKKSPFPAVSGLYNLGNTCFFNAVLQCLARTPFLVKILDDLRTIDSKFVLPGGKCKLDSKEEKEVDLPPIEGNLEKLGNNTITSVLCQTLINMQNSNTPVRPYELLCAIKKKTAQCMDGGQHDSHEFLRQLLELVRDEDVKRYKRVILDEYGLKKSNTSTVDQKTITKLKFYGQQANRLLESDKVFRGILDSTIVCLECNNSSSRTEPFLDLSLPVMSAKPHPPAIVRKENTHFNDDTEKDVKNSIVNKKATSKSRKKWSQKKNRIRVPQFMNNNDSLPNENSITEEKPDNVEESEELDADVEDNIETEGVIAPEVGESGYSSEKVSAVASPVPLGELPISNPNNDTNGLPINEASLTLNYWDSLQIEDNLSGNAESTPSPIDVSMADLNQVKVIAAYAPTDKSVGLLAEKEEYFRRVDKINDNYSQIFGPSISPGSNTPKDTSTSPASSVSPSDFCDSPILSKTYKKLNSELKKEENELTTNDLNEEKSSVEEYECNFAENFEYTTNDLNEEKKSSVAEYEFNFAENFQFTTNELNEEKKSSVAEYEYNFENANNININSENTNNTTSSSPKQNKVNSLRPKSRYNTTADECSIQSCLNQFTALELMTGNNKVGCAACTARENKSEEGKMVCTQSTKQYLILQVPSVLILHLKRFEMFGRGFSKVMKHISFPIILDLSPVCKDHSKKRIYALYGVVVHQGTFSGGHYVSYVKSRMPVDADDIRWSFVKNTDPAETNEKFAEQNTLLQENSMTENSDIKPPTGQWYCVSDSTVAKVDEAAVLRSQAYLLFYERIH